MSGSIQDLSFPVGFISLTEVSSGATGVSEGASFLRLNEIPSSAWLWLLHPCCAWTLCRLHRLASVDNATMTVCVHTNLQRKLLIHDLGCGSAGLSSAHGTVLGP